uniref:Ribosomal protein S8 n=1 Tax=Spumella sp. NIES-1846 TaxID=2490549 RepID=A0A455REF4_9STRA|nr:ribosomal protein S8 [Spumella sp. NIES-1846]
MSPFLISQLFTHINNACKIYLKHCFSPYSKTNFAILNILKKTGIIKDYNISSSKNSLNLVLNIYLLYFYTDTIISSFQILKVISKPQQRIYCSYKNFYNKFPTLRYNQSFLILSTSLGIMTHNTAQSLKIGGEILGYVEPTKK